MKLTQSTYCILLIFLLSCTSNTEKDKKHDKEYITFENLNIAKKWIEIPNRNTPGPSRDMRDLRTVQLTNIDKKNAIVFNYGYETQWFQIKRIEKTNDSLLFESVLPFDTTETMYISVKFLDKDKFIARWIIDDVICNYFPYKDTLGNNKVSINDNHR